MNVLVIDSQGGGIGKQVIMAIKQKVPDIRRRLGDAVALQQLLCLIQEGQGQLRMLKAGADHAATGENAVIVGCRKADVIIGPIGIVIADAMYGEITPNMAVAVGQSNAKRLLIPVNHCDNIIIGAPNLSLGRLVDSLPPVHSPTHRLQQFVLFPENKVPGIAGNGEKCYNKPETGSHQTYLLYAYNSCHIS